MVSKGKKRFAFAGILLIGVSLISVLVISPNIAPEFNGSANLHIAFEEKQELATVADGVQTFAHEVQTEQESETDYTLKTQALTNEEYTQLQGLVTEEVGNYSIKAYESFSPSISQELVRKSVLALIMAVLIIIGYIALVFRGVSRPIASWKYGVVSTIALLHDAIIPLGVFAVAAPFSNAMIDTLFVTALLATLGYSINDTIVIFDRIRDRLENNKGKKRKESFDEAVDYGVKNSLRRSLYTSASTIIPLLLIFTFVPAARWFAVALLTGVLAGTYSSLFFAPSLLLFWHHRFPQKEQKERKFTETELAEEALRRSFQGEDVL